MILYVDRTGTIEGLQNAIRQASSHTNVHALLIVAADDNGFLPDTIDDILKKTERPLFGGIFPQILYGREKLSKGSIVVGFRHPVILQHIENISNPSTDIDTIIDETIPDRGNAKTIFVIADAFSNGIGNLVESLFNIFGLELNYLGGGAGSVNPVRMNLGRPPCVLTNDGLKKDCAALALVEIESGIGVKHGWDLLLSGPYRVTESAGNVVKSLDWKPAFEVYQQVLHTHANTVITRDNFFDIAKSYPFGIAKLEAEQIVRDPFDVSEDNGLIFITEIPQESFVNILTGNVQSLIHAASLAYREGVDAFEEKENKCVLVVDCISRVLFLGEHFNDEIEMMAGNGTTLIGVLSIGEIANNGKDYLELYNKTCVVGIIDL